VAETLNGGAYAAASGLVQAGTVTIVPTLQPNWKESLQHSHRAGARNRGTRLPDADPAGGSMETDGDAALHLQVLLAVENPLRPGNPAKTRSSGCPGGCSVPPVPPGRLARCLPTQGWHAISSPQSDRGAVPQPAFHGHRKAGAVPDRFKDQQLALARKSTRELGALAG